MRRGRRGFSLIEVVVAMVVLGIAFVTLFGLISQSLSGIPRIERARTMVAHARSTIAQLGLIPAIAPDQRVFGVFDDGAEWIVETALFVPPTPTDQGHMLRLSVSVEQDGSRMSFHTYRFQQFIPPGIRPLGEQLDALRQIN